MIAILKNSNFLIFIFVIKDDNYNEYV